MTPEEATAKRLELARGALTRPGGFEADEVDDDIAPRIIELMSAWDRVAVKAGLSTNDEDASPWTLRDRLERRDDPKWADIPHARGGPPGPHCEECCACLLPGCDFPGHNGRHMWTCTNNEDEE